MRRESIKLCTMKKKKKVFLCVIRVIFFETKSIKFDIQMEVGHNKSNYRALHRGEFRGAVIFVFYTMSWYKISPKIAT
jgi:hypothetical protein